MGFGLLGFLIGFFLGVGVGARPWRRRYCALDKAAAAFLCSTTDDGRNAQANRSRYGREVGRCLSPTSSLNVAAELERQERKAK